MSNNWYKIVVCENKKCGAPINQKHKNDRNNNNRKN